MRRERYASILATAALLAACSMPTDQVVKPTSTADVIVIGADFPLSGPFGTSGRQTIDGVQFAVAQAGRIGKFRLLFRPFDNTLAGYQDPVRGVQDVEAMASDARVLGMVGPFNSGEAAAEIPVASQYQLPMVSPSATSDCLTLSRSGCVRPERPGGMNNFFRLAAFDSDQGIVMADFAVRQLGITRVAVLSDGHPYGENLARAFSAELQAAGGTVVLQQSVLPSTYEFSDLLQQIKARGAQAIYAGGSPGFGVCRIRAQMPAVIEGAYFLGGDALLDKACANDAKGGADDHMLATIAEGHPTLDNRAARVVSAYTQAHYPVGGYTFAAYDCAQVLIDAIRRAIDANGGKVPTRQQVIDELGRTHFVGITGTWSFNSQGDATAPAISVYRVNRGAWTFWKALTVGSSG